MKQKSRNPSKQGTASVHLARDSLAYALRQGAGLIGSVLQGRNLTESWEALLGEHPEWPAATRGAVRDLAWSTLREYGPGDAVLDRLLSKPLPDDVHAVLLQAINRLRRNPDRAHTTVDQAVQAVASIVPGLRGVANGVLRNCLRRSEEFEAIIQADDSLRLSHPDWWVARVKSAYPDVWQDVLYAGNTHPPMSLRVNRRKIGRDDYRQRLQQAGIDTYPIGEDGLRLTRPVGVGELPDFESGLVSVQDAGAQRAAQLLDARPGERVLDACSAPGGKTAHILERAGVHMTALDVDRKRLGRVQSNLARLGLQAECVVGDARMPASWWNGMPYDRILADVPCSASGVVRRHPDIKWLRRDEDIAGFAAQQAAILDALWPSLAPGGTMLYATCSVFDEENGAQIAAFCDRHPDVERLPLDGRMDLQLLPNAEHDGFYYALLRKTA
ncbi:MAG: 16S rRNA (cytosine(967)-C(5))-methyltransferase RsmB [Pseudazoarcus pumilus]|nr:16S rRNA (cytosine(967)-C(5))-methyltransferase RsmB [Pseudazoarcus pumilus]